MANKKEEAPQIQNEQLKEMLEEKSAALELMQREAAIEVALEKVRARTMSMQRSDELADAAQILFQQVTALGVHPWTSGFQLWNEDRTAVTVWTSTEGVLFPSFKMPTTEDPLMIHIADAAQKGETLYVEEMSGESLANHYKYMRSLPSLQEHFKRVSSTGHEVPRFQINHAAFFPNGYLLFITHEPCPEAHEIFKRFAKVFEQTYTRFLDLQKAEAQAREAKIEAALERVRTQSMLMQHSNELNTTLQIYHQQLQLLGINSDFSFLWLPDEENDKHIFWATWEEVENNSTILKSKALAYMLDRNEFYTAECLAVWKSGEPVHAYKIPPAEVKNYCATWQELLSGSEKLKPELFPDGLDLVEAYMKYGCFGIFINRLLTEDEKQMLRRFTIEFERAYTRFLDLQKAEEQARESQIQLSMERIRARTMAMQHSVELADVASIVFKQLYDLGIKTYSSGFNIWEEDDDSIAVCWMSGPDGSIQKPFSVPYTEDPFFKEIYEARQSGKDFLVIESGGAALAETYRYMFDLPGIREIFIGHEAAGSPTPTFQITHCVFFPQGYLMFITLDAYPEAWDIFKRFGKVFEQTYTRFLDLQKAEAQAREAQIQLAMERVRARTMAMQKSDELAEAASLLFKQIEDLGITAWAIGFDIWLANEASATAWMANPDGSIGMPFVVPYTEDPFFKQIYAARQSGTDFFVMESSGKELEETYQYLFNLPDAKKYFDGIKSLGFQMPAFQITHCAFFSQGFLMFITYEPVPEMWDIFKRFAVVFEQTYTRFLDLQKAEAQAREAMIEAGLERVRSRAMAMHNTDELLDAAELVYKELSALGIESMNISYAFVDEEEKYASQYSVNPVDGKITPFPFVFPHTETEVMRSILSSWKKQEPFNVIELDEEATVKHQTYIGEHVQQLITKNNIDIHFSVGEFLAVSPKKAVIYTFNFVKGYLFIIGEKRLTTMQQEMVLRFTKVFEMTYRRFLDLKQAEAQAREARIELAMERVRARTMAMQRSDELPDAALLLSTQVKELGVQLWSTSFQTWDNDRKTVTAWTALKDIMLEPIKIPATEDSLMINISDAAKKVELLYVEEMGGKVLENHLKYMNSLLGVKEEFEKVVDAGFSFPTFNIFHAAYFSTGFILFITEKPYPEAHDIFKRFAKVFEQTYTRFLDLQNAEEQARESQIQLALERVRARTMAMQRSDELADVAKVLFQQVKELDITAWTAGFNIWHENNSSYIDWVTDPTGEFLEPYTVDLTSHPFFTAVREARQRGDDFFVSFIEGEQIEEAYRLLSSFGDKGQFQKILDAGFQFPASQYNHYVFGAQVSLMFITYEPCPEAWDIFKRFGKVFEQTYTRFLDLQKAEAQAREAKIETALEKVRSRTMAMQKSEELQDTAFILFQQIQALDISIFGCGFNIWDDERKAATAWMAREDGIAPPFKTSSAEDVFFHIHEAAQRGESLFVREQGGEELETHYRYMATIPLFKEVVEQMAQAGFYLPTFQIMHCAYFTQGYLMFISYGSVPEAHDIFKRFAKVFEQTYTRFLDLQKAEVQAREAQIELALERVRARAMSMQNSDELSGLVAVLFEELTKLNLILYRCIIWIFNPVTLTARMWMANSEDKENAHSYFIKKLDHPYYKAILKGWKEKKSKWVYDLQGKEKKVIDALLLAETELVELPDSVKAGILSSEHTIVSGSFNNFGLIEASGPVQQSDEQLEILSRFGKVFDLTYTRFNDLKQAEAQASEAIKRASVDRVRAEIASMRTTLDLEKITPLVWNELTTLSVPFIRCGVFIMDEEQQQVHTFLSTPDGKANASFHQPFSTPGEIAAIIKNWRAKQMYRQHWNEAQFIEFTKNLVEQGAVTSGEKYLTENRPTNLDLHFLPFLQGMLYVGNPTPLGDDELQLVQNLADAFSTAYARYDDFNKLESAKVQIEKTLVDLKQAQAQLVQSAKMASLGELTAGIAHEIQNPLNFVNNFSEVNTELIAELKEEMDKGNMEDAKAIANDIADNEQKINHHGKRADAIVKGMLQHSRSSTSAKEPTNINALADEYLRLAYHGLRAKDKSFNATLKTDFDESIGNINIIPQDIGRVLLNLYNNAFYAAPLPPEGGFSDPPHKHEPTVWVSTKRINTPSGDGGVFISVKDNGPGIPQKIVDKIFQPFFTTKPTGQGTGLGLSLAYDIVKTHGGELKVDTKEGEGSEFIIHLPVV